jgi:hypothetical protein
MVSHRRYSRRQFFANAAIADSRVGSYPCVGHRFSCCPKASANVQGALTDAACTFMMRPTTAPSASTSKSSSFHSPDDRLADARLKD